MRVYEVAKLLNVSNKELIETLAKAGFEVKSHMAALSPEALDFIDKKFKGVKEKPSEKQLKEKPKRPKIPEKKPVPSKEVKEIEKVDEQEFFVKSMTVAQVSEKLKKPVGEIILTLLKQGVVCTKNQMLSEKAVEQLAKSYEFSVRYPKIEEKEEKKIVVSSKGTFSRLPVVVVLGHVDHGKTTLLDFIRKTRIAQKEKGGITQHLGAYEAVTPHGNLVLIDTPGHEAFSNIRGRGVRVADLAVLVIAADDSVKPQTIEAITKIKKANIPVVVAVNKMDKVDPSRLETIKSDLARYDLLAEEWGGQTVLVPISAKLGDGIDKLLEMVILQSQLMDLRADIDRTVSGFILESKLQKGLGPVATVICQQGTLSQGDFFAAGHTYGKVSALIDSYGKRIKKVGPSVPVQVSGFSELPQSGDFFEVVSQEKFKKLKSSRDVRAAFEAKKVTTEESINIILKTDTTSSKEALLQSIEKVSNKGAKKIYVVHAGVGDINESDVALATNTSSMILGLHVKIESNTIASAQKNIIRIMLFDIIYKLLEYLEELIKKEEPVKMITKKIGEAVIRKVFQIKNIGTIAGSYCKEGIFSRKGHIVAWRGKEKIGEGPIKSLERDRKPVKEVHAGFEFAFLVNGIDDWQVDDRAECFIEAPAEK